ncbi:uncharacterized protein LOC123677713 isoform X2 [Harmonia axyridis]|uniref:uncharacterized protein LOC123677713 isoform X2 n=1 Tax=Harmonia axyridis TaxID=115357 RepID=UPI001E27632F|nr:uncharacterized protein LOC123677713 isoform X2 [Harmonia axyridis]
MDKNTEKSNFFLPGSSRIQKIQYSGANHSLANSKFSEEDSFIVNRQSLVKNRNTINPNNTSEDGTDWSCRGNKFIESSQNLCVPSRELYLSCTSSKHISPRKNIDFSQLKKNNAENVSPYSKSTVRRNRKRSGNKDNQQISIDKHFLLSKDIAKKQLLTENSMQNSKFHSKPLNESEKNINVSETENNYDEMGKNESDCKFNMNIALELSSKVLNVDSRRSKSHKKITDYFPLKKSIYQKSSTTGMRSKWISIDLFEQKAVCDETLEKSSDETKNENDEKCLKSTEFLQTYSKSDSIFRGFKNNCMEISVPATELFIKRNVLCDRSEDRKISMKKSCLSSMEQYSSTKKIHKNLNKKKFLTDNEGIRQITSYDNFPKKYKKISIKKIKYDGYSKQINNTIDDRDIEPLQWDYNKSDENKKISSRSLISNHKGEQIFEENISEYRFPSSLEVPEILKDNQMESSSSNIMNDSNQLNFIHDEYDFSSLPQNVNANGEINQTEINCNIPKADSFQEKIPRISTPKIISSKTDEEGKIKNYINYESPNEHSLLVTIHDNLKRKCSSSPEPRPEHKLENQKIVCAIHTNEITQKSDAGNFCVNIKSARQDNDRIDKFQVKMKSNSQTSEINSPFNIAENNICENDNFYGNVEKKYISINTQSSKIDINGTYGYNKETIQKNNQMSRCKAVLPFTTYEYDSLEGVSSSIVRDPECRQYLKDLIEKNNTSGKQLCEKPLHTSGNIIDDIWSSDKNVAHFEEKNFLHYWENILSQNQEDYSQNLIYYNNELGSQRDILEKEKISQEGSEIFQYLLSQNCVESDSLMNNALKNMNTMSQKITQKRCSTFESNSNSNKLLEIALNIYREQMEKSILFRSQSTPTVKSSEFKVIKENENHIYLYKIIRNHNAGISENIDEVFENESSTLCNDYISIRSEADEKILFGLKAICENKSYLYAKMDDGPLSLVRTRLNVINEINNIFEHILNDLDAQKSPYLEIPRQTFDDCMFMNGRLELKSKENLKMIRVKYKSTASQFKFCLMMYILAKVLQVLEANSKITRRELYYQIKHLVSNQGYINRAVRAVSCMLFVGPWDLNIIAHKGMVFGNLKIIMSSNEIVDCNLPGTLIPQDTDEIVEFRSPASFVLVVEKESIFYKLLEENLPNKLIRSFIMITGKGFPDLNTQLFLRKLWMVMSIPILIFTDADPHGVNIMMTYRFGSLVG